MHDELTAVDIRKMQEEIDYREMELRPKLIEDVQAARGFGDLSENFEYKAAKQAKNKNESRIRYLKRMIASAVVIEDITLVTTLRQNPMKGLISKESPVGKAVLGHKAGERVFVPVGESGGYWAQIRAIEKGVDDESMEISPY